MRIDCNSFTLQFKLSTQCSRVEMNLTKHADHRAVSDIELESAHTLTISGKHTRLKKLRGALLTGLGFMLSPLCWWNDLVFNLPIAYGFGYLCSFISSDWLMPGAIVGYWLSNLAGILLMQFGIIDMAETQDTKRNFTKDLLTGVATSTVYTLIILAVVQLKLIDISGLLAG